jgi:membrane-bound lytic murein transglycosylase B
MNRHQQQRRALLAGMIATAMRPSLAREPARQPYLARSDVQQLIDELVWQHGFERERVERWIGAARYSSGAERLMQPPVPFGQRNWLDYRDRVLQDARVRAGAAFLRTHAQAFEQAKESFGVPPEVIAAIIGIETRFGRLTGNFRTLDVLATLAFDYQRRAEYYRREFIEFMLMAREQRLDPLAVTGSFAGAIGLPQFMPGSIRRYAVDFDGDGRIDLSGSPADAIGSVASFLVAHGWQPDLPILFEVEASEAIVDSLGRGITTAVTWYDALAAGVDAELPLEVDTPVIVIDLPYATADGAVERQFRVGTANFSAILHYNRSYFYATAVVEFAQAIATASAADAGEETSSPAAGARPVS